MIALRICRNAAIADVDAWLASLPEGQLDEYLALEELEPWSDTREGLAQLEATLHNVVLLLTCVLSGTEPPAEAFRDASDCLPGRFRRRRRRGQIAPQRMTDAESEATLRAMCAPQAPKPPSP